MLRGASQAGVAISSYVGYKTAIRDAKALPRGEQTGSLRYQSTLLQCQLNAHNGTPDSTGQEAERS